MKRILLVALGLLLLFSLCACQNNNSNAEIEAMKTQMQIMQQQLNEAMEAGYMPGEQTQPEADAADTPENNTPVMNQGESGDLILALHSTIDGETMLIVDGATELTATAIVPEGMAVDYWELSGALYYEDMEDTFTFTTQGNTVVDARLRPEHKVTTINAEMQFLDKKGNPKGEKFTEFVFEEEYENPVTHEIQPGDWITVYVNAVVPKGYAVDYWLINDVPYYYNRTVTSFTVHDLNETTVYEVVLKKENAPSSTAKPTSKPTQQPVTTPRPTQQPVQTPYVPEPTQAPVTYYNVSCENCTFSGGGYSGATSGRVPAGTNITVTSIYNAPDVWKWSGSRTEGSDFHGGGAKSFSYTVNSDCSFYCRAIIN